MYNVYNADEVYYLYNVATNEVVRIGNKNDLIVRVASMIGWCDRVWWRKSDKWTENSFDRFVLNVDFDNDRNVFTKQNLTGKDMDVHCKTERKDIYDEELEEMRQSYITVVTRVPKPYIFYTSNGAIYDVRNIINEVKEHLISGKKLLVIRHYRRNWCRRWCNHKTYGKSLHSYIRERRVKAVCEELGVKYRHDALPHYGNGARRSSGWKDKKYKKQWMHNLDNKKIEQNSARKYWSNFMCD